MKSDTWDVNELIKAFKEELEAREKTRLVEGSGNVVEKPWLKPKIPCDPITAAALFLPERGQANCYFCNHPGHRLFNCTSVTDPEKRKEILKNQSATVVTRGYAMYRNSLKLAWMFLYAGFYCSKNNTTIRSPNSRTFVTLELWSTCRSRHPYIFSKSKR